MCYNEFSRFYHHHNYIDDGVSTQFDHGLQQDADMDGVGRQDFTAYLQKHIQEFSQSIARFKVTDRQQIMNFIAEKPLTQVIL